MQLVATLQTFDTKARMIGLRLAPLGLYALRLEFGWPALAAGLGKIMNFGSPVLFFDSLGLPIPTAQAALVSVLELVGGGLLMLGSVARPIAAALASTMVVAILTADLSRFLEALRGSATVGLTDVTPVVFLLAMLVVMAFGAGSWSLDNVLQRRIHSPTI